MFILVKLELSKATIYTTKSSPNRCNAFLGVLYLMQGVKNVAPDMIMHSSMLHLISTKITADYLFYIKLLWQNKTCREICNKKIFLLAEIVIGQLGRIIDNW